MNYDKAPNQQYKKIAAYAANDITLSKLLNAADYKSAKYVTLQSESISNTKKTCYYNRCISTC